MIESMLSVGIDLGTSTTQMVISKLTMNNMASAFTIPRIEITSKEVLFRSDIIFTPLKDRNVIDVDAIKQFLDTQYLKSGIKKDEIQIGAVIITGETARKENSSSVLQAMSGYAGDFVVATAGPDLESIIAGKGAGAQSYSKEYHTSVANLDIGGGTTNLVLFKDDDLLDTACFDIGGRLIRVDKLSKKITYISPKLKQIIEKEDWQIQEGTTASAEILMPIIKILVAVLENSVGLGTLNPYYELLVTNKALKLQSPIECLSFSGGVADCIQENQLDLFEYGDIGLLLGRELAKSRLFEEKKVIQSAETIRATVVGAGSHTTKVSGSTITYDKKVLPVKNIPVLKLSKVDEQGTKLDLATSIKEKLNWFTVNNESQAVALGLTGTVSPSFQEISDTAKAIVQGFEEQIAKKYPLIIILQEDNGKSLGQSLYANLPKDYPFVCIDGIQVENGDYVDIGMPIINGSVLPVVVKTLVFE
ncbi:ethanolamine ammonia-lyase reactivating factor EutA [Enterococcus rivorum]|uniref:Ethanolamine ammonia-lyase n=1 Tax=Enterococcus rivorum TaxID=762845 RepID=A0A1E5KWG5_9ENTE|nr:ethanolamine ammonia-lyase reactivating factor EutA [Enterococcus rivorum]MBP2099059.1 ethanolamine utilization protein EutA [Enterococcus rivorum]OEH82202.1 ethanolamine ammonia-lyase [Enterococcus rivorum]